MQALHEQPAPRERPILFSAPMVRAILDGRKTQTRRIIKPQPPEGVAPIRVEHYSPTMENRRGELVPGPEIFGAYDLDGQWGARCRFGRPGDRLWVKETYFVNHIEHVRGPLPKTRPTDNGKPCEIIYRADGDFDAHFEQVDSPEMAAWRPSMHMVRWASRITLEVTGVRVERLHEIGEDGAKAEGVTIPVYDRSFEPFELYGRKWGPHRIAFNHLWESINGAESWHANPWVWVVEFRRTTPKAEEK